MRLIDAHKVIALLTYMKTKLCVNTMKISALTELLKIQETIDAVEVVRCKDCVYFRSECYPKEDVEQSQRGFCDCNLMDVYDCDYCSNGERRKNEAD